MPRHPLPPTVCQDQRAVPFPLATVDERRYCAYATDVHTIAGMSQAFDMGRIPPSRLSYRLLIARLEAGLKQEELAALMGCGRTVVSNAEKGKGPVRKIVLNAWALATGVPISWLEHGDGGWYPPEDPPAGDEEVRPEGFEPPTFCLGATRKKSLVSVDSERNADVLPGPWSTLDKAS
ncbi:immunity repressor [Mycobacterium phage Camri]|nr:immunity repressor [Mycobacterium phage Camri]